MQIWRPFNAERDTGNESFTLVGTNIIDIEPILNARFYYVMPDEGHRLSVEIGDALGLYIEDTTETDGDFRVEYRENVTDSVLHVFEVDDMLDEIEVGSLHASDVWLGAAPVVTTVLGMSVVGRKVEGALASCMCGMCVLGQLLLLSGTHTGTIPHWVEIV